MVLQDHLADLRRPFAFSQAIQMRGDQANRWLEVIKSLVGPNSQIMKCGCNRDLFDVLWRIWREHCADVGDTIRVVSIGKIVLAQVRGMCIQDCV